MRFRLLLIIAAGTAILSGCESVGPESVADPGTDIESPGSVVEAPVEVILPEEGLTPRERMRKSLALLETGRAEHARVELNAYLVEVPDSRMAKDLLGQIDSDPVEALGAEFFLYTMRQGESISSVSKKMLGDPLKFYLLARYNDLENPSEIKAGQIIRVPGTTRPQADGAAAAGSSARKPPSKPSLPAAPVVAGTAGPLPETPQEVDPIINSPIAAALTEETAALASESEIRSQSIKLALLKVKSYSERSDFNSAVNHAEEGLLEYPDSPELQKSAVEAYSNQAERLLENGDLESAEGALRRAVEILPGDAQVQTHLAALQRRRDVEALYQEAARLQGEQLPIKAYDAYAKVIGLDPQNADAQREMVSLRPAVAAAYHRQAITAYRQQDLEKAVAIWDKVLREVDPEFNPAKVYRAQAIDLLQKLQSLPGSGPSDGS